MSLFGCKHEWEEARRAFLPPANGRVKNSTERLVQELAFGITIVELRCVHCKDIKERKLLGDHT